MNRNYNLLLVAFAVVLSASWGCDDASSSAGGSVTPASECDVNHPCTSPLVCVSGHCVSSGSLQACAAGSTCPDGQKCVNDKCLPIVGLGENCGDFAVCSRDASCLNGHCRLPSGAGDPCSSSTECGKLECINDICSSRVEFGNSCDNAHICTDSECIKGICAVYAGENEHCDNKKYLCAPGFGCGADSHICTRLADLGEYCDTVDITCLEPYQCDVTTHKCAVFGKLGDTCNANENKVCDYLEGYICVDDICATPVMNGGECSELARCVEPGSVCYLGKCLATSQCESDKTCGADTYCCLEDSCDVKGVCVPYGTGPRPEVNLECKYETVKGLFEAAIQCEWTNDPEQYPNHDNVLMTPLVMDTPHDSGQANEIIFTTYNSPDGGTQSGQGADINLYGVIRIINAETCKLLDSIYDPKNHVIAGSNLSMADLDGDGKVEIVASRGGQQHTEDGADVGGGIVIFHWDSETRKYVTKCNSKDHTASVCTWDASRNRYNCSNTLNWGGSAIHDINDDGKPEIIGYGGDVFDADCKRLNPGQSISELSYTPTLGDLDGDGKVEIIGTGSIYRWNSETNKWDVAYQNVRSTGIHEVFADFGTRNADGTFDFDNLDGIAETAGCGSGIVELSTLQGEKLMRITGMSGGGPCTIGDFDGDKLPEIATAFGDQYRVFDPRCKKGSDGKLPDGCKREYVLWEKYSQDASSASTGSSLFDFDGDGAMEAVYADECYTRVYDGKTGDVLFSAFRSSGTWHEYPVIADVDNDESAEIVVGSNNSMSCASPDPIHRGLRCKKDADCKSNKCVNELCRCTGTGGEQCNSRTDMAGNVLNEYNCVAPLEGDEEGGNVCRAIRSNATRVTGVRVMRDRLDRWTSSRNLWNQHAYSITNINDDMTIPKTSSWIQNFLSDSPVLNNFRQNVQGERGANSAPDITGKLDKSNLCTKTDEGITLTGKICNRGTKMVASLMPASFYKLDADGNQVEKYCTAYTKENVPVGGCMDVSCVIKSDQIETGMKVRMVSNDDGNGGRTTVECIEDNNSDEIVLEHCAVN